VKRRVQQPVLLRIITDVYRDVVAGRSKDQNFWILGTFVPTFVLARLLVHYFPHLFISVGGNHVHHFAYGFIILAVAGYLAISRPSRSPAWLAALFGIGLGLAVDEAGMWLHLTSQYYNETSENAIIAVGVVLINLVYFREFWLRLIREIVHWLRGSL